MFISTIVVAALTAKPKPKSKPSFPVAEVCVAVPAGAGLIYEGWKLEKSNNVGPAFGGSTPLATPEPSAVAVLAFGLVGLLVRRKRK